MSVGSTLAHILYSSRRLFQTRKRSHAHGDGADEPRHEEQRRGRRLLPHRRRPVQDRRRRQVPHGRRRQQGAHGPRQVGPDGPLQVARARLQRPVGRGDRGTAGQAGEDQQRVAEGAGGAQAEPVRLRPVARRAGATAREGARARMRIP